MAHHDYICYCSAPRPNSLVLYYAVTTVQGQLCETRLHNRYVWFRHISSVSMYIRNFYWNNDPTATIRSIKSWKFHEKYIKRTVCYTYTYMVAIIGSVEFQHKWLITIKHYRILIVILSWRKIEWIQCFLPRYFV